MSSVTRPLIAFVDDEPMVLDALKRSLRSRAKDWDMIFFPSAEAFWDVRSDDWPDVAVLDLTMPGWSGLDLATRMREAGAQTRCIMLTGNASLKDAMGFINEASVFRYYMKPCAPEVLGAAVDAALADARERSATPATDGPARTDAESLLADRLSIGTVVLDADQGVSFVNKIGLKILGGSGALSQDGARRLRAGSPDSARALDAAIRAAAETGETGFVALPDTAGGSTLHVTVCGDPQSLGTAGVTLFISDPDLTRYPTADTLSRLFALTGSESRLVEQLVRGLSLEEAAEANGLKISSARTYLKAIFQKMGVVRQAELVQKALTTSASVVRADQD
ncbi:DNA-binding response regulator [Thalassobaculum salexigens]|uniref:DNA-binding response regulator n=1 Tax=Thalassobaculum salexigens TaxID=455360 RepID=UPI0004058745|nr:DNA-binding response regulator [Thalassobaculum salexigens]